LTEAYRLAGNKAMLTSAGNDDLDYVSRIQEDEFRKFDFGSKFNNFEQMLLISSRHGCTDIVRYLLSRHHVQDLTLSHIISETCRRNQLQTLLLLIAEIPINSWLDNFD